MVLLGVLSSIALAKYEDQFGKVYDWKKAGLSRPVDAIAGPTGTFLVHADSFTTIDPLGSPTTLTQAQSRTPWIWSSLTMLSIDRTTESTFYRGLRMRSKSSTR